MKKFYNIFQNYKIILLYIIIFPVILYSCKGGACAEDSDVPTNKIITSYHKANNALNDIKSNDEFSIFLDYSSGMKIAFKDTKTEAFYNLFINSLKISNVNFYEVDKNDVIEIKNLNKSDLYKKIKNTEKFSGINAPLNKALKKIVSSNSQSVFITDGELWENGERDDPWAREEFSTWLKKGNTIEFYVTNHVDADKEKHLFYMFFTPKDLVHSNNSISEQFKFYIKNSVEAKSLNFSYFSFSNQSYTLVQEYKTNKCGGANDILEIDNESFVNKNDLSFEFHEYFLGWNDIMKYIYDAYDDLTGKPIKGGDPIISKLFLEIKKLEFFNIDELGIRVYDIKKDFDKFKAIKDALNYAPMFVKDDSGKKMLDEENNPIIECPGQTDAYDEKGNIKIDTLYKKIETKEVKELFIFDHQSFINNIKEQGRGELIIKIHSNFNGSQISNEDENFHKIEIYLKKVSPNTSNENLKNFIWDGKQVEKNRSLYNSILGALNEVNPQGRVIYTFYIKTQVNDYMP